MIYEFRTYEVAEGRMQELIERFQLHTLRLFKKHGITPVLFSKNDETNVFQYIVSFPDKTTREESWSAFLKDEERMQIWEESNRNGKLVTNIRSESLEAVEF